LIDIFDVTGQFLCLSSNGKSIVVIWEGETMKNDLIFKNRDEFRNWLIKNHAKSKGIWMVLGKGGDLKTIKANEALEEALCFGWIDGQIRSVDEEKYLKKFTPRRKGSNWSEKNKKLVDKLIQSGEMTEYGLRAVAAAKKDGRWDKPKPEPIKEEQIEILINALSGAEPALSNFLNMPMSVKKTYTALYLDAKKEDTRVKRLEKIIERLNENKKPM
jgi:uncharacterized protein YdeI (YjbR/CyaY-like superfamily)